MCNKKIANTLLVVLLLCTGGCALHRDKSPHNNVLVFGTTTKFALDVAAPVQNASIPEFTLGYKRLEAVWMPLKPNNYGESGESKPEVSELIKNLNECMRGLVATSLDKKQLANFCLTLILPSDKYVSVSSGVSTEKGGKDIEIDTYSVFASLGAKGTLGFNSASGNLAQFFATGVAAQRLGANQAVGFALNAEAPDAVVKMAKEENEEKLKEAFDSGATVAVSLVEKNEKIIASVQDKDGINFNKSKWESLKASNKLSEATKNKLKSVNDLAEFKAFLRTQAASGNSEYIDNISQALGDMK